MKNTMKTMGMILGAMVIVIAINVICNINGKELDSTTFGVVAATIGCSVTRACMKKNVVAKNE